MNRELVGAEWTKATGALRSAKILTRAGEYNDAVTRTYYAMRHASLAALAARGTTPPRTHQGLQNAVRNTPVRPGGDPGIEAPPARPVSQPRGPAGNNPDRER